MNCGVATMTVFTEVKWQVVLGWVQYISRVSYGFVLTLVD